MRKPTPIKHGTTSGYRKELARGLKTCAACRAASSAYQASRKAAAPDVWKERAAAYRRAREQAVQSLILRHPAEYRSIHIQARREEGLHREPGTPRVKKEKEPTPRKPRGVNAFICESCGCLIHWLEPCPNCLSAQFRHPVFPCDELPTEVEAEWMRTAA